MLEALRGNPALLKLDLYCQGVRLDDSCFIEGDGGRKILRTRAGLGSGLELILPGGLWTNVPVTEHFVARSPYTLHRLPQTTGRYLLRWNGVDFDRCFEAELAALAPLADDGLVELGRDRLTVTPAGRLLVRNVAMAFDAYLGAGAPARYSRTV